VLPSYVLAQVETERRCYQFQQIFATGLHLRPNCAAISPSHGGYRT
jgi:hypothetical protein